MIDVSHEPFPKLLHDTVLNTLTALARAGPDDVTEVVSRCRQDVALIEGLLSDPVDLEGDAGHPYGDVIRGVQAVAAQAAAIHEQFVTTLGTSAGSYAATEAANAAAAG